MGLSSEHLQYDITHSFCAPNFVAAIFKFIFLETEVMKMTEYSTLTRLVVELHQQTVQVKCRYTDIC